MTDLPQLGDNVRLTLEDEAEVVIGKVIRHHGDAVLVRTPAGHEFITEDRLEVVRLEVIVPVIRPKLERGYL